MNFDDHLICQTNPYYKRHNVGVIGVFEEMHTKAVMIISSVHLFWDAVNNENIQCLQVQIMLEEIQRMVDNYKCPIVLVGDFNNLPNSNPVRLVLGKEPNVTTNEFTNTEIKKFYKKTNLNFKSSYENYDNNKHPAYTIFDPDFQGCIDYIFHTSSVKPTKVLNTPDTLAYPGIPDALHPSDHLPLKTEFIFHN